MSFKVVVERDRSSNKRLGMSSYIIPNQVFCAHHYLAVASGGGVFVVWLCFRDVSVVVMQKIT